MRIITAMGLMLAGLLAQAIDLSTKVKNVTIYQNQAEVTRIASFRTTPADGEYVITGLSRYVNENSIQVKGIGDFIILGTSFRRNFLTEENPSEEVAALKAEITLTEQHIALINNELEALEAEKGLLKENRSIKGVDQNLTVNELSMMADFFRERMLALGKQTFEKGLDIRKAEERLAKLKKQLSQQELSSNMTSGEIVVEVSNTKTQTITLEVSYIVDGARWEPIYDLRASENQELEFNYKAIVYQQSGENWEDIKLTLSLANPSSDGTVPDLLPWYLDFNRPRPTYRSNAAPMMMKESLMEVSVVEEADAQVMADYTQVNESLLSKEYEIQLPVTILSGNKGITVGIRSEQLDGSFTYQSVPKLSEKVYLVAQVKAWGDLDLLPGAMNVYYDGAFINKTYLNPNHRKPMQFSLGVDESIKINRESVKNFTGDQFIGNKRTKQFKYEMLVENQKSKSIILEIHDQLPVSQNEDISVEPLDLGGASLNTQDGNLTWKLDLKPKSAQKINFGYEVKYPRDKDLSNL